MPDPDTRSLLRRISRKIVGQPDVEAALAGYPDLIPDCWIWTGAGSTPTIRVGKTSTTVVRALFEAACGERLLDCWTPRRNYMCCSPRCVNPSHFDLKPHNQNRYGMEGPLPAKLVSTNVDEVQAVMDLLEEWERPPREAFVARCAALHFSFSDATIDAAYARSAPAAS